jgi:pilus retraction protein PilT
MTETESTLIVRRLLSSMDKWSASDIFVCEGKQPAARVHGSVVPIELPVTEREVVEAFLAEVATPQQLMTLGTTGDLDVGYTLPDGRRFRFNFARQRGHLSFVARAVPSGRLEFADLGLPDTVAQLAELRRGLVLITGGTGSGKSTTVAAIVHRINSTRSCHVVTIEDPIEFAHQDLKSRISQREIGQDTESWSAALRHAVRQSPDVIVIGEMRDWETMETAIAAALTGHLVLATLHTVDATQTLQRILSQVPDHARAQAAMDLSMSLEAIVSQRLIPREDGKGRVLAYEVLKVSPAVRRLIHEQRVEELLDMMKISSDPGMLPFNDSLLRLFRAGLISFDAGRSYSSNPDEFALAAQGMKTGSAAFNTGGPLETAAGLDMKALLALVIDKGASDLHLTVGRPPIFRISGQLFPLQIRPLTPADMRVLLFSILTATQRSRYELDREIDFALALENGQRFRVNAYYQKGHMSAALRAITTQVPEAHMLGLPDVVLGLGERPHGLLLVVGPTGSGKSTTLACLVDRINRSRACRIITVEDPIEYTHQSLLATIDQREVGADTLSFAKALKYVLRQDPDVILVGEMRDLETISAAITAAETGHLVLATLHTNDAIQAIDRVIDVFPSHQQPQIRSMLSNALIGVVSQRLIPRADGIGRVGAFEVIVANSAIRNVIRDNKMHQAKSLMETRLAEGMITMDRALRELYQAGLITREDALRFAENPRSVIENERPAMAHGRPTGG